MKDPNTLTASREKQDLNHPIHPLLAKRWSPRIYASESLSGEEIATFFEAARWAPSSYNEQPWRFIYVRREQPEAFQRLLECLAPANQEWVASAPLLVVGIARTTFSRNGKPNRHAWHDLGQAIAHLTFQATAMDLYVHQMGGFSPEKVRELYDMGPDFEPATLFTVGRLGDLGKVDAETANREAAPQTRNPQSEWVFENAWAAR